MAFTIAELGNARVEADPDLRPVLVMTSNSEKALPDPFLRRCIFYHISFPGTEQLREIVLARLAWAAEPKGLLDDALELFFRLRDLATLRKRPATAELLGWLVALRYQGGDRGNPLAQANLAELMRSLPCLVKTAEDLPVAQHELRSWADHAQGEAPVSTPFESLVDGLVPFLEGLRSAGYRVETKQILAAHGLLATLAERGQLPEDLAALRTYLGPIVCASHREQEDFGKIVSGPGSGPFPGASLRSGPRPTWRAGCGRSRSTGGRRGFVPSAGWSRRVFFSSSWPCP